jgi:hypothetical protein
VDALWLKPGDRIGPFFLPIEPVAVKRARSDVVNDRSKISAADGLHGDVAFAWGGDLHFNLCRSRRPYEKAAPAIVQKRGAEPFLRMRSQWCKPSIPHEKLRTRDFTSGSPTEALGCIVNRRFIQRILYGKSDS